MKNTDTAGHKGYDAGKKVSGIKRHIAVDTQGLPHAIHVTTADVTDRAGALAMFDRRRDGLSQVQNVLVDGGYTGKPFATAVQGLLGASVEVVQQPAGTAEPGDKAPQSLPPKGDVVGIFPNRLSARRLVGAVLAEQHDEWAEARRYLTIPNAAGNEALPTPNMLDAAA